MAVILDSGLVTSATFFAYHSEKKIWWTILDSNQ